MKFRGILLAAAILFFAGSFHAYAQEEGVYELPAWLVLEYGKKAFQERELGIALRYAREALEKKAGFYPEAEILIGDVFAAEGNLQLAVSQYTKALEDSRQLYILQEKYHILYRWLIFIMILMKMFCIVRCSSQLLTMMNIIPPHCSHHAGIQ